VVSIDVRKIRFLLDNKLTSTLAQLGICSRCLGSVMRLFLTEVTLLSVPAVTIKPPVASPTFEYWRLRLSKRIISSFVHGYKDDNYSITDKKLPCLAIIDEDDVEIRFFENPRNIEVLNQCSMPLVGEAPLETARNFEALPRFGMTGLAVDEEWVFAGGWNGVYKLDKVTLDCEAFISHRLMNDLHGIAEHELHLITVLTGKDTVVVTDMSGNIVEYFTIYSDLRVKKNDERLMDYDWRFLSKQFRGATGIFHFNYVQVIGEEIWLTSRNLGCFVVLDTKTMQAKLRTINQKTTVLLHDGAYHDGLFYFTSIDGKIIISSDQDVTNPREKIDDISLFNRDLSSHVIRIKDTGLGYEPNWCRGIDVYGDQIACTIDGFYGTDLSFKVALFDNEDFSQLHKVSWSDIGNVDGLKYVTGFDVKYL